ncbi:conserved hypothetical protein [Vibrio nigripulchritudo MADA3029]|uniref:hypothetical protein n=1 Tax=Vibrio nigripulchritudo TaxID=28173 RepID=UPI0003B201D1|nr:hypothetical protein [Vibrio nigripulchritudo]CCN47483.1 conserved hypothetical protein [Vibrio nigripulchritudo MADA3020]CCN55889.1 conserved hypothetical protein [Vibrio nigripulchritudo MADA3021]CCN57113.1 conserved hypothetical protein [Vibrio nigripulchritudo MADA3029]
MKKILVLLLLFPCLGGAQEWGPTGKVTEINSGYVDGSIIFGTTAPLHNPKNCSSGLYYVGSEYASVSNTLSLLLSAQARGADIKVAVNTNACGKYGHPVVTRIKLLP